MGDVAMATAAIPKQAVIPRASGVSSTPRLLVSIVSALEYWIARSSRATTNGCATAIPARDAPEFFQDLRPLIIEGAGKAGCPLHPQPRV
jgi:hypothetical protein